MIVPASLETYNIRARAWFDSLRDRIVTAFETMEDEAPDDLYPGPPGRFELKPWDRPAGGGGVMDCCHDIRSILNARKVKRKLMISNE